MRSTTLSLLAGITALASAFHAPVGSRLTSAAPISVSRAAAPLMAGRERTYIMIKPDGVQRGLVGEITKRFEQRGYKLQALKLFQARATSAPAACSS